MMNRRIIVLLLILLSILSLSCTPKIPEPAGSVPEKAAEETAPEPNVIAFSKHVGPLFAGKCTLCHHPDNAVQVDLTQPFDPETGIILRPNTWTRSEKKILVVPGDPEASALVWKIEQTRLDPKIDGDPMPWDIPLLTEAEIDLLRRWISEGAQEGPLYPAVARLFGDGISLGSRGGKCGYCHYTGSPVGPDLTAPFNPEHGINGTSRFGGLIVSPGDPETSVLFQKVRGNLPPNLGRPMPLHYSRFTIEEIETIKEWILQGAENN